MSKAASKVIHLNAAGIAPLLPAARDRIEEVLDLLSKKASQGLPDLMEGYEKDRATLARFLGATPEKTAFFSSCAAALSQVAFGLSYRHGDEIVTWDQEYPSNQYPWHEAARKHGLRVVTVPSEPDLSLNLSRLIDSITERTRVVAVSWVQYQTGAVTDLKTVAQALEKYTDGRGWLVVDGIQGLGVMPFNLEESGAHVICGAGHKWMMSPVGIGFMAMSKRAEPSELTPVVVGNETYGFSDSPIDYPRNKPVPLATAKRFEPGAPFWILGAGLAASAEKLEKEDVSKLYEKALKLAGNLEEGLRELGEEVLRPKPMDKAELMSPIVTFRPKKGLEATAQTLKDAGVSFAIRAEAIRLSPHPLACTAADIEKVLKALKN